MAAVPPVAEAVLREEQGVLDKRRRELTVAQAELQSLKAGRRTYLKAGEIFFARPAQLTKEAVAGPPLRLRSRAEESPASPSPLAPSTPFLYRSPVCDRE